MKQDRSLNPSRRQIVASFVVTALLSLVAGLVALLIPEPPPPAEPPRARFFNAAVVRPGLIVLALMIPFGAIVGLAPVHAARSGLDNAGLFFLPYAAGLVAASGERTAFLSWIE